MAISEETIQRLIDSCTHNQILINPSIRPKFATGRGFGIYAANNLARGEKVLHVPTEQVFTTSRIPLTFLSASAREGIAAHAQLAAFFAFGSDDDLEPYHSWMESWPAFQDFYETMPIFWSDGILAELKGGPSQSYRRVGEPGHPHKRQKPTASSRVPCHPNPDMIGAPEGPKAGEVIGEANSLRALQDQVEQMTKKIGLHIKSVSKALPHLKLLDDHDRIRKYLHAWCLVNTRCFYYVQPISPRAKAKKSKLKPPADRNEAMGLCPFMDLFNHIAPSTTATLSSTEPGLLQSSCNVRCNAMGFTVTTSSNVDEGAEVLVSYGAHNNDTLWSEYGFLLPGSTNSYDSISLDGTIVDDLTSDERETLDSQGYLGGYTLLNDGSVCYRTETAAWIRVLGSERWIRSIGEGLDPTDLLMDDAQPAQKRTNSQDEMTSAGFGETAEELHREVVSRWLKAIQKQAQGDSMRLRSMTLADMLQRYRTLSIITEIRTQPEETKTSLAERRHKMCIDRCDQIYGMASRGMEKTGSKNKRGL